MENRKFFRLSFCFFIFCITAFPCNSFAQPSIRVLLVDGNNPGVPQKDEKLCRSALPGEKSF